MIGLYCKVQIPVAVAEYNQFFTLFTILSLQRYICLLYTSDAADETSTV